MDAMDKVKGVVAARSKRQLQIDIAASSLLIIDMQEYQTRPGYDLLNSMEAVAPGIGSYYVERVQSTVEPNIQKLLDVFRRAKRPVLYTAFCSEMHDGSDLAKWAKWRNKNALELVGEKVFPHKDEPSAQILKSLEPGPDDLVIYKTSSGTLNSTDIVQKLRNMNVESVVVTGVLTNVCVETTARDLADRSFDVIVVDDACTTHCPELHDTTLLNFQMVFGWVRTTAEMLEILQA